MVVESSPLKARPTDLSDGGWSWTLRAGNWPSGSGKAGEIPCFLTAKLALKSAPSAHVTKDELPSIAVLLVDD